MFHFLAKPARLGERPAHDKRCGYYIFEHAVVPIPADVLGHDNQIPDG